MIISIFLTFIAGLFILIGGIVPFFFKNQERLHSFSIGLSISVLILMLILDLIPESYEILSSSYNLMQTISILILVTILGIVVVKILDNFIPEHNEFKTSHVALMTSIALFIHNIIEGMALYVSCKTDLHMGAFLVLGVSMHNFALGLSIGSEYYTHDSNKKKLFGLLSFLMLSTLLGGILMLMFNMYLENSLILGIILSLTIGMITYIIVFELIPHFIEIKNKKTSIIGLVIGSILMLITLLFHSH